MVILQNLVTLVHFFFTKTALTECVELDIFLLPSGGNLPKKQNTEANPLSHSGFKIFNFVM
jgi:hypothetical protein